MADPLDGPNEVTDALEQFLPNVEPDARKYLERAGLNCSERNLNEAMRAIWIGTVGAQALFNQGLTPAEPPSSAAANDAVRTVITFLASCDCTVWIALPA